jgi:hypothetical protein
MAGIFQAVPNTPPLIGVINISDRASAGVYEGHAGQSVRRAAAGVAHDEI